MTVEVHSKEIQIQFKFYLFFVGFGLVAGIITRLSYSVKGRVFLRNASVSI